MCGICGIFTLNVGLDSVYASKLKKMNNALSHRGNDDEGYYFTEDPNIYFVGLGHKRLSIIDLETGRQPIFSSDSQKIITFNGEIYNYKKLREEHFEKNEHFFTETDTEVILKLYEKFDVHAFGMLDGMFSITIYDKKKKKIILARDFFGEKPLYYTKLHNDFFWASELKSIILALDERPNISQTALNQYFRLTYIPAPFTIYENIWKLEPYQYLELDCMTGDYSICQIKESCNSIDYAIYKDFNLAKQHTFDLISESVKSRMISDVPIGMFLSGGVDSSIVSLIASMNSSSPIDTFSIGFEKKEFNEVEKSRIVAKIVGSNHHEFICKESEMAKDLHRVILDFDEPFADSSCLPSFLVAKKSSSYVKVVLTGDGGDEVFGGYNKYLIGKINKHYTNIVPKNLHYRLLKILIPLLNQETDSRRSKFRLNRLIKGIDYNSDFYFNIISLGFSENELEQLFINNKYYYDSFRFYKDLVGDKKQNLLDFRNIDRHMSLEGDMCVKVDRTAMLTSIETRSPFLNKDLWNFTSELPENYLIRNINKKYLLKKTFEKYFPKDFLEKSKQGFGVPVGDWLRTVLRKELESYSERTFLEKQGLFNIPYIQSLVKDHINSKNDNTFRVWTFYCFQLWYKNAYLFNSLRE